MSRPLLLMFALCLSLSIWAQPAQNSHPRKAQPERPKIEDLVSNLTSTQKTRIDLITRRSTKKIEEYRTQLKVVRDSIRSYMGSQSDMSAVVFPLYEREAKLQVKISKEFYRSKVEVDKVLTPQQFQELSEKMKEQRAKQPHKRH